MIKFQKRTSGVIAVLLMLGASPLSVTYSFAEIEDNQGDKMRQRLKIPKKRDLEQSLLKK